MIPEEKKEAESLEIRTLTVNSKNDIVSILNATIYQNEFPDVLYHYTDIGGLMGILNSNLLWATDSDYLNDELELEFGKTMLLDEIDKSLKNSPNYKLICSEATDLIEATLEQTISRIRRTYILSYCSKGDLLSQWRGYGSETGISLGFHSSFFEHVVDTKNSPESPIDWSLEKVYYGDEAREIASSLAQVITHEVIESIKYIKNDRHLNSKIGFVSYPLIKSLAMSLEIFCSTVKHEGFKEESEYRIVGREKNLPDVKFRTNKDKLVPYVELHFPKDFWTPQEVVPEEEEEVNSEEDQALLEAYKGLCPDKERSVKYIDNIVIGPTADFQKQVSSIKEFLRGKTHGDEFRAYESNFSDTQEKFMIDEVLHQYRVDMYITLPKINKSDIPLI